MTEASFVDTNIFVYARDRGDPAKQKAAARLLRYLWERGLGRTSVQVLNEFFAVMTQKYGLDDNIVESDVRNLFNWQPVHTSDVLLDKAFAVRKHYRLNWRDCLVIAAASTAQCKYLFTEDLSESANYSGVIIKNPFSPSFSLKDLDEQ